MGRLRPWWGGRPGRWGSTAKAAPDGVQLVLKEPDTLVQAALLGQDGGLAGQEGTVGTQLPSRQCPHQNRTQGALAPCHMLLQLPGVLLLSPQEPETLQQRGLEPTGRGTVSGASAPRHPALPQPEPFTCSSGSLSAPVRARARCTRARRLPSSSRRPSTRSRSAMNRLNRSRSRGAQAWPTAASSAAPRLAQVWAAPCSCSCSA